MIFWEPHILLVVAAGWLGLNTMGVCLCSTCWECVYAQPEPDPFIIGLKMSTEPNQGWVESQAGPNLGVKKCALTLIP